MTSAPEDRIRDAVDSAEEVPGPLDGLPARTEVDPGTPFAPEVLQALLSLRQEDRARFEGLRAQLKRAGCRVSVPPDHVKVLPIDREFSTLSCAPGAPNL